MGALLFTSCNSDRDDNPTFTLPASFTLNVPANANNNVYDLSGRVVKTNAKAEDLNSLKKGIYIYNNKKYVAK